MAVKLNLSTPPADIVKTLIEEFPKCVRWYVKRSGGEKALEEKMQIFMKECIISKSDLVLTKPIDYNPPSGNHWICYEMAVPVKDTVRFRRGYEAGVIWETEGYFGMFYRTGDDEEAERNVFIFTPHFFQRYCERMEVESQGLKTLQTFLSKNECYRTSVYDKDGVKHIYLRLKGCIGLGKVLSENPLVAEIRTVLPDAMLTANQLAETEQMRKEYDELVVSRNESTEEAREEGRQVTKFEEARKRMDDLLHIKFSMQIQTMTKLDEEQTFADLLRDCMKLYATLTFALNRILGKEMEIGDIPVDMFLVDQFVRLIRDIRNSHVKNEKEELEFCMSNNAETYTKIAWHNNLDVTLEQMQQDIADNWDDKPKHNKQKQSNSMNQQAITQFKNLLSQTGLTKKFSTYCSSIDDNKDRYIQQVEAIYAISRFLPSIMNIKDKEKFINANKLWMKLVVENGYCAQLKEYIEQYGKDMVSEAICYLIDNDLWSSPEDKKGLSKTQESTFDGLKDIHSAVDYLKEKAANEAAKEEEQPAEPLIEFEIADKPKVSSGIADKYNKAKAGAEEILGSIENLKQQALFLQEYLSVEDAASLFSEDNELTCAEHQKEIDELQEKNLELCEEINEMKDSHAKELNKLQKEVDEKVESIRISQQKFHAEEKAKKEAQQQAYDARKERAAMATELDDVKKQLREVQKNYDELRKQAREPAVESCRILPASALKNEPYWGPTTQKGVREFLRKYKIFFDDEARRNR